MSSRFEPNPAFIPFLEDVVEKAMGDLADDLEHEAQGRAGWSSSVRGRIKAEVKKDGDGPLIEFTTGGSLQNIAEQPKGLRRTRKGANRGAMRQFPVMVPTKEAILSSVQLNLGPYL